MARSVGQELEDTRTRAIEDNNSTVKEEEVKEEEKEWEEELKELVTLRSQ